MILSILTFIHLAFCLLAIGAGIKVMSGLFAGALIEKWAVAFFRCALAASVTGLLFSFRHLSYSHWIAMSSVYVSGAAILAWRKFHLDGIWRSICAFCIPIVLSLNILLVTAQAFKLIPALRILSPTQSEPVFLVSQISVLILFAVLGAISAKRFRSRANQSW
jgi:hypothetical protein